MSFLYGIYKRSVSLSQINSSLKPQKAPFCGKGLSFPARVKMERFQNLPIFSPVEPFWIKNKFFNFFVHCAEKFRTFAPLIEKP